MSATVTSSNTGLVPTVPTVLVATTIWVNVESVVVVETSSDLLVKKSYLPNPSLSMVLSVKVGNDYFRACSMA